MVKIKEDEAEVCYKIETDIVAGTYISDKGKKENLWKTVYAFCKVNKHTGEFELDHEKTDSYFLFDGKQEIWAVRAKLNVLYREKREYPEKIGIATG